MGGCWVLVLLLWCVGVGRYSGRLCMFDLTGGAAAARLRPEPSITAGAAVAAALGAVGRAETPRCLALVRVVWRRVPGRPRSAARTAAACIRFSSPWPRLSHEFTWCLNIYRIKNVPPVLKGT